MRLYGSDGMLIRERDDISLADVVAEMVGSGHWREPLTDEAPHAVLRCSETAETRGLVRS